VCFSVWGVFYYCARRINLFNQYCCADDVCIMHRRGAKSYFSVSAPGGIKSRTYTRRVLLDNRCAPPKFTFRPSGANNRAKSIPSLRGMLLLMPAAFAQPETKINLQWPAAQPTVFCIQNLTESSFFILPQIAKFNSIQNNLFNKLSSLY
jgi:hypothetical protein